MGLILLTSKSSLILSQILSYRHQTAKRDACLQIQGLVLRLHNHLNIGFMYCRSTPNEKEIKGTLKSFKECQILMGDFNLSPKLPKDLKKLNTLCGDEKNISLKEITRTLSCNQPDHILIDKQIERFCYVTSYFNFISDHNSIVVRIGDKTNLMTKEAEERVNFNADLHLKAGSCSKNTEDKTRNGRKGIQINKQRNSAQFKRNILNPDAATCWLNACLQLVLTALDSMKNPLQLNSELGKELNQMQSIRNESIDPTFAKNLLVLAEDTRIAVRKSEIMNQGLQKEEIERQLRNVDNLHLNLRTGQQCIRDFFLCLQENLENWLDVYQVFSLNVMYSTKCKGCRKINQFEQNQLYIEIDVPPNKSKLSEFVEEYLNGFCEVEYDCNDGCKQKNGAENRATLMNCKDTEFIIVILRIVVQGDDGLEILQNTVSAEYDIQIRYLFKF